MTNHFWCPVEKRCLPSTIRCNYIQECLDGYDEMDCGKINILITIVILIEFIICFALIRLLSDAGCGILFDGVRVCALLYKQNWLFAMDSGVRMVNALIVVNAVIQTLIVLTKAMKLTVVCNDKTLYRKLNSNFVVRILLSFCTLHQSTINRKFDSIAANFTCANGYRKCITGQCIPEQWWCDYFEDCPDRSDEMNCPEKLSRQCVPGREFRCDNGQCISNKYRCLFTANHRQQCADRSNLSNCTNWTCQQADQMKCAGSYCFELELKCNEKLDCPVLSDWADEHFCRK